MHLPMCYIILALVFVGVAPNGIQGSKEPVYNNGKIKRSLKDSFRNVEEDDRDKENSFLAKSYSRQRPSSGESLEQKQFRTIREEGKTKPSCYPLRKYILKMLKRPKNYKYVPIYRSFDKVYEKNVEVLKQLYGELPDNEPIICNEPHNKKGENSPGENEESEMVPKNQDVDTMPNKEVKRDILSEEDEESGIQPELHKEGYREPVYSNGKNKRSLIDSFRNVEHDDSERENSWLSESDSRQKPRSGEPLEQKQFRTIREEGKSKQSCYPLRKYILKMLKRPKNYKYVPIYESFDKVYQKNLEVLKKLYGELPDNEPIICTQPPNKQGEISSGKDGESEMVPNNQDADTMPKKEVKRNILSEDLEQGGIKHEVEKEGYTELIDNNGMIERSMKDSLRNTRQENKQEKTLLGQMNFRQKHGIKDINGNIYLKEDNISEIHPEFYQDDDKILDENYNHNERYLTSKRSPDSKRDDEKYLDYKKGIRPGHPFDPDIAYVESPHDRKPSVEYPRKSHRSDIPPELNYRGLEDDILAGHSQHFSTHPVIYVFTKAGEELDSVEKRMKEAKSEEEFEIEVDKFNELIEKYWKLLEWLGDQHIEARTKVAIDNMQILLTTIFNVDFEKQEQIGAEFIAQAKLFSKLLKRIYA